MKIKNEQNSKSTNSPPPQAQPQHVVTENPEVEKKTPMERAFAMVANIERAAKRLQKLTAGWDAENNTVVALNQSIKDLVVDADSSKGRIAELAEAGFVPTRGRAARGPIAVGQRVLIRAMLLKSRYAFLDKAQTAALFVEKEVPNDDGKAAYLVVCRPDNAVTFPVGVLRAGALEIPSDS